VPEVANVAIASRLRDDRDSRGGEGRAVAIDGAFNLRGESRMRVDGQAGDNREPGERNKVASDHR
jgi:hypothetical protein